MNCPVKKRIIIVSLFSIFLLFGFFYTVFAESSEKECSQICGIRTCVTPAGLLKDVTSQCYNCGSCSLCDILQVFVTIATRMFTIAGGLALIIFIWGGIDMIMSAGRSEKVQSGKQKLVGSVIGMLIMMFSWLAVGTVIKILMKGSGGDITNVGAGEAFFVQTGKAASIINWYTLPKCSPLGKQKTTTSTTSTPSIITQLPTGGGGREA